VIRQQTPSAGTAIEPRQGASRAVPLAIIGGLLLPLAAFAALAAAAAGKGARGWDADILRLSERHYRPSVASTLSTALEVAVWLGAAIAAGVVILLLLRRKHRPVLFFVLAVGGVVALDLPLKELFRRPPWSPSGFDSGAGYAFPSGHAMATMATVAAIALLSRRWRPWTLAGGVPLVVASGIPLVYAWWHYPSDVVAGWCFALAWVTALWLLFRPSADDLSSARPVDPASGVTPDVSASEGDPGGTVLNTATGDAIRDSKVRIQSARQHRV
jgi:membrane-associated phospholipid phosphatase